MGENPYNEVTDSTGNGAVKEITNVFKKVTIDSEENNAGSISGTAFKVAGTNLPEKTSMWTKVKNALFYEIKVELTPYQQKVENEINEYLHQDITWKSLKEAALSEVIITFRGKRVF